MNNAELKTEFEKVEKQLEQYEKENKDTTDLLKQKIVLLQNGYKNLNDAIDRSKVQQVARMYAELLAFLNNIKTIQVKINDSTTETDEEISKIHEEMRKDGLGWLLDNMPTKQV